MSTTKDQLKRAMDNLQINKPLRLKKPELQFKAPETEVVQNELARIELGQNEIAQNKLAQNELGQNEQGQSKLAQSELVQSDLSQNGPAQIQPARNELAQNEPAVLSSSGFFKMPHNLFFDERVRALSGDCFRLYLWMLSQAWRYENSDGVIRAAIKFIEIHSGLTASTVKRSLVALKDAGLIELVEQDFKKGNRWRVVRIDYTGPSGGKKPGVKKDVCEEQVQNELAQSEQGQNEMAQNEPGASSKWSSCKLNLNQQLAQNEPHIRNIINNNKYNNSLSARTRVIEEYLKSIKAPAKQQSESDCFEKLVSKFCMGEIEKAFLHIQKHGALSTGDVCHSPMAYLTHTMDAVLKFVADEESKAARKQESLQANADRAKLEAEESQRERLEIARRELEFLKRYPSKAQQREILDRYKDQFPMLDPDGAVYRRLVIGMLQQSKTRTIQEVSR